MKSSSVVSGFVLVSVLVVYSTIFGQWGEVYGSGILEVKAVVVCN